ncbi:MAG: lipopolysaccharide kinase InaA family protein [Gemmatimonadaceae bacterium]
MGAVVPTGYVLVTVGRCTAVARVELEDDARALLAEGTLYEAAARDLAARPLPGRGVAYAIALPVTGARVVVRHNRHGGLLAPLTKDFFLPPTRAPHELDTSLRLAAMGVRTPTVSMYGVERVYGILRRADVMTLEVMGSRDLATYLLPGEVPAVRAEAWRATRALVRSLNAAGARHHDLNVKNVLLADGEGGLVAWVLDVDRVRFGDAHAASVRVGNATRLLQSARKWRTERGAVFDEREVAELGAPHDASLDS